MAASKIEDSLLLEGYSSSQQKIITGKQPVKQVVAGAGSGKTRTVVGLLTFRLRKELEEPGRTLLLSFSRKAVQELRERLPQDLRGMAEISTFHSFCLRNLRQLSPQSMQGMTIMNPDTKEAFLYDMLQKEEEIGGIPIKILLKEQEAFRHYFPKLYARMEEALIQYKQQKGLVEYEDLITLTLDILRDAEKNPLAESLRRRYTLIIVDEFQDTDPRQFEFLRLMKAPRIVVVGDDWQAIYAFRGATVEPFLRFRKEFKAQLYYLKENYRSLKSIVDLGSKIISASSHQISKKIRAVRGRGPGLPLLSCPVDRADAVKLGAILQYNNHGNHGNHGDHGNRSDYSNRGNHDNQSHNLRYRILVRSNYRRKEWLKAGFAEEAILTIHKSKGLEFPVVFLDLCGGWGNFNAKENDPLSEDEEIRILYVGASRAMNLLIVFYQQEFSARSRESYYLKKLIQPYAKECRPEEIAGWLKKEELHCGSPKN